MAKRYSLSSRPHAELLDLAIRALQLIRPRVLKMVNNSTGLRRPTYPGPDGTAKEMLVLDQTMEDECANFLIKSVGERDLRVLGEEDLWKFPNLDLSKQRLEGYGKDVKLIDKPETRVVAVIDMIDGSDLVERNFGNWCSAMIFFKPGPPPKIMFSLVHNADGRSDEKGKGTIYGADEEGTFLISSSTKRNDKPESLRGPEFIRVTDTKRKRKLEADTRQITVCFYSQKCGHLATMPASFGTAILNSPAASRFRTYNLAGNPMMARLANGENVHAVFEHRGQHPHDAAPGAYIGLQAQAYLVDLDGNQITSADLAAALLRPSGSGLKYILASCQDLGKFLIDAVNLKTRDEPGVTKNPNRKILDNQDVRKRKSPSSMSARARA